MVVSVSNNPVYLKMWRKAYVSMELNTLNGRGKSNPTISKVREAVAMAKAFGADSVLSIGGGSCLDSAKAIAAGACYDGDTLGLL